MFGGRRGGMKSEGSKLKSDAAEFSGMVNNERRQVLWPFFFFFFLVGKGRNPDF